MKRFFTFLSVALAAVNAFAAWQGSGQGIQVGDQWYALYETDESSFSTISSKEYTLQAPAAQLTYDAKCVPIKVAIEYWGGDLKVAQYLDGGWSGELYAERPPKNSYQSYGPIDLSEDATKVKLYTTTGATGYKYMKNVFATMATYLEEPSLGALDFGSKVLPVDPAVESLTFTLPWCNTAVTAALSGEGAEYLSVSCDQTPEAGHYATSTYTVSYNRAAISSINAALTISGAGQNYVISISGETTAPALYGTYTANVCDGDSIEFDGVWYKEALNDTITLSQPNQYGGDSVVVLTVTKLPTYLTVDTAIVMCEGATMTWRNEDLSAYTYGIYNLYDSLKTDAGCDSVYCVAVTIHPIETVEEDDFIIAVGTDSLWNGIQLNELPVGDTLLTYNTINAFGCDSVVTVTVHVENQSIVPTSVEETMHYTPCTKYFRNGQLIIRRGDEEYLIDGRRKE